MRLNFIWTIILIVSSSLPSFGQQKELKLTIQIKNPVVNTQDDLLIKLTLTNQTNERLLIHKHISFGYLSNCFEDDFCLHVEKILNSRHIKMEEAAAIDRIAGFDSTGKPWAEIYDTLNIGEKYVKKFNINGYYSFDKGKYRVRFCFQLPAKNNLPTRQIYSNWLSFEVKARHIVFHL